MMDQWQGKTAQADNSCEALSAVYKWAVPRGRAKTNPCVGIANTESRGGAKPWTAAAEKGSPFVSVPIANQLLTELRATKVEGKAYILSEYGRPFRSAASLHERVRGWVAAAVWKASARTDWQGHG
jgi:hypothetical protein